MMKLQQRRLGLFSGPRGQLCPGGCINLFNAEILMYHLGALKKSIVLEGTKDNNLWANPYTKDPDEGSCTPTKVQLVGVR